MFGRLLLSAGVRVGRGSVDGAVSGGTVARFDAKLSAFARSAGELSTSYAPWPVSATQALQTRHMSGKGKKGAPPAKAGQDAPAAPDVPVFAAPKPKAVRPYQQLAHKAPIKVEALELLTPEQRALAQSVVPPPPGALGEAADEAPAPAPLTSLKQVGLPVDTTDVVDLVHQSLSNALGQSVQLQPFVFSNLFQSAPVVANYVAAALEAEYAWPRIERFFLSSIETDLQVKGIKVLVSGRQGRKATMASKRVWQFGQVALSHLDEAVDYGHATAMTRMGSIGIKVWLRYHDKAVKDTYAIRKQYPAMQLNKLIPDPAQPTPAAAVLVGQVSRMELPWRSTTAWWATPGPLQPMGNASWECFKPDFGPERSGLQAYLASKQPLIFTTGRQRAVYLAAIEREKAEAAAAEASRIAAKSERAAARLRGAAGAKSTAQPTTDAATSASAAVAAVPAVDPPPHAPPARPAWRSFSFRQGPRT